MRHCLCVSTWKLFAQVTAIFHPGLQDGWVTRSRTPVLLWEHFHETAGQTKMASLIQHVCGRWSQQSWLDSRLRKLEKVIQPAGTRRPVLHNLVVRGRIFKFEKNVLHNWLRGRGSTKYLSTYLKRTTQILNKDISWLQVKVVNQSKMVRISYSNSR